MEQTEYFKQCSSLRSYLFRYALKLTHDRDLASDLVQETLIRGWRYLNNFTYGSLVTWLICIEKRLFLNDFYKQQRRSRRCRFLSYEDLCERNQYFQNMRSREVPEISDDILQAVDKLPAKFKSVFKMARLEGYEQEEISRLLSIPTGTVKSRLFRADSIMKVALRNYVSEN